MKKRVLSVLLIAALLLAALAAFAACEKKPGPSPDPDPDPDPVVDILPSSAEASFPTIPYEQTSLTKLGAKAHFFCETDKKPYELKVGEDIVFTIRLGSESEIASCPFFCVRIYHDGLAEDEELFVSGTTGQIDVTTRVAAPGFVYLNVFPCKTENAKDFYKGSDGKYLTEARVGAGAELSKLAHIGDEPANFDAFWKAATDELLAIDPEILVMEKVKDLSFGGKTYDVYNMRVACVADPENYKDYSKIDANIAKHDFVAGLLTVPRGVDPASCALCVEFNGHGVGKQSITDYRLAGNGGKTILFNVLAHSYDAYTGNGQTYLLDQGGYGMKYGNETDPNNVYYKKMILRDLQAVRFVERYFGANGTSPLWDGRTLTICGGSQGGFQAAAVSALLPTIGLSAPTLSHLSFPWLADMEAGLHDPLRNHSAWWPDGKYEVLAYFDTVFFCRRIANDAEVKIGLGDNTTCPYGVTLAYNNLRSANKSITFVQSRSHGSVTVEAAEIEYTVKGDLQ